jgi:hypothetical protein
MRTTFEVAGYLMRTTQSQALPQFVDVLLGGFLHQCISELHSLNFKVT